jgi:8-oxo-dGTP pyrophosphatase MutT (NUDIX family)
MNDSLSNESLPTYEQRSAGGVVYRQTGSVVDVAIVKIVPEMRWQLPKGVIDEGETSEQAALREVREESGIEAEIIAPIDTIEYWFTATYDGERRSYHKFVDFYLMAYVAGDVKDHDHEVAEARWTTVEGALTMLEFQSERDVVTKASAMIADSL